MVEITRRSNEESYRKLLEKRLKSFGPLVGPEDPRFQYALEYDLRAVERGKEIVDIFESLTDVRGALVLDLGCGTGGLAVSFAQKGARVVGLDVDWSTCELAVIRSRKEGTPVDFLISDGVMSPFPDSSFDVVICNDVFEHVEQKKKLAHEIRRLLKMRGLVYIRTPNKFSPWNILRDDHTGLPFITLLPKRIQNFYVKIARLTDKGLPYTLRPPTYASLMTICSDAGLQLDDQVMQKEISEAIFHMRTDILSTSRSNLYPRLTTALMKALRWSHDVCKLMGLSSVWWLAMRLTYPTLSFMGRKTGLFDR